jgi:hypothetical protein
MVLKRRWPVLVVGMLILTAAVVGVAKKSHSSYQVTASMLLVPPTPSETAGVPNVAIFHNPILLTNRQLATLSAMTASSVNDSVTASRLAASGATASYSVGPGVGTLAAILSIQTSAASADLASRTAVAVEQAVADDISQRQASMRVADELRIRVQATTSPMLTTSHKNRTRLMATVTAVGLAATVILAFFIEGLAVHRRGRRQNQPVPPTAMPI